MSRVTIVVNNHEAPSETFQRSLATTLVGAGHEVTIHALRRGVTPPAALDGVHLSVGFPPPATPGSLTRALVRSGNGFLLSAISRGSRRLGTSATALSAALTAGPILATEPDVVHLGFSGIGVALADALELLDGIAIVVSCRGTDELVRPLIDPERGPALARLLGRVDRVHAVADAVAREVVRIGAPPERVQVIRPAVDLATWPSVAIAQTPVFELLSVGRLEAAKGHDDTMAALASMRDAGIDARLTILGGGPHHDALVLRRERSGLEPFVTLAGTGSLADVRQQLARSHLFICASHSEGINNGVLEAMASRRPVVATDVGGMSEVITDGRDGWLVPTGRPDLLAATVSRALGDVDRLDRIASAGRRRVEDAFGRERQDAQWLDFYRHLVPVPPRLHLQSSMVPR